MRLSHIRGLKLWRPLNRKSASRVQNWLVNRLVLLKWELPRSNFLLLERVFDRFIIDLVSANGYVLGNKDEALFVDHVAANDASNLRLKRRWQFVICSQGDHDKSFGCNFFRQRQNTATIVSREELLAWCLIKSKLLATFFQEENVEHALSTLARVNSFVSSCKDLLSWMQ